MIRHALVLALLLTALPVRAGGPGDFKTRYTLALALYEAQRYEESIPEFQAAYKIDARPALLFNIAQAYRKAGRPKEAIEYYDRYLEADPKIDAETRRKVDGYLAEARNTLAALELAVKQRLAEEKAARDREAEPPKEPPPAAAAPPPPPVVPPPLPEKKPPPPPLYKRWWLWTAVGGGVAAAVVVGAAVGATRGGGSAAPPDLPAGVPTQTVVLTLRY
jgi:tetratricopeptide (TPR) repeat protein